MKKRMLRRWVRYWIWIMRGLRQAADVGDDGLDLFAIELAGVRRHGAGDVAGRDLGVRVDDRFDQEGIVCHRGAAIGQGDVRSVQAAPAGPDQSRVRSEERRVGKEWVRTCSTWWSAFP